MANYYVRSSAAGSNDGSSWANAYTTLGAALTARAAGSVFWVADDHAETSASDITLTSAGTSASPCIILCVNTHVTQPPTAKGTGATITCTGNANSIIFNGYAYSYGISYRVGSGASGTCYLQFGFGSSNPNGWNLEATVLQILSTGGSSAVLMGLYGSGGINASRHEWNNTTLQFSAASQSINLGCARFCWKNTPSAMVFGTLPTNLFTAVAASAGIAEISGVDLSALTGSNALVLASTAAVCISEFNFRNCKLGASVVVSSGTIPNEGGVKVNLDNCDSGNVNYRFGYYRFQGSIVHETTVVRTGGASDGTTPISHKMVSLTSGPSLHRPLESPPMFIWNEITGSSRAVVVEFIHDSVTNLQNADIWLEVEYLGTASLPISSYASSRVADEFATAVDCPASALPWTTTGLTNPNVQKLSVVITAQVKGLIRAKVMLAKTNKTVYVDPIVTVS